MLAAKAGATFNSRTLAAIAVANVFVMTFPPKGEKTLALALYGSLFSALRIRKVARFAQSLIQSAHFTGGVASPHGLIGTLDVEFSGLPSIILSV